MIELRPAKQEDLEPLAALFAESFTTADPEKPWDQEHAFKYLEYWLRKQPDMFYVATQDGELAGGMVVNIKPWRTGIRCNDGVLFVGIKFQRKGIGKMLFKKVISEAQNKYHAEIFEGITFAGKEFPMDWYNRLGISLDQYAVVIKGSCTDILKYLEE